ncbi:MAG: iron-containing alcohol dehydrogenase [Bacteroidales bacterium]|nr:iron-containing alcohol dehydrogenase [Bacteroidales bacterium]
MTLQYNNEAVSYKITIAPGALAQAGELLCLQRKVLVVTDKGVPSQYAEAVLAQCPEGYLLVLDGGEENKSLDSVRQILAALLEHGFTRKDAVVAVGGGVVGDTAGFAASCYMRGIDWYNVPTTLLSQVDSSVGGKTGVNFQGIKNIVGAFHHPSGVIIDTRTLDTLSPRLFAEGLAEVIKMAATSDAALFRLLEDTDDLRPIMEQVISAALSIKLRVVTEDPTEHGLRAVLNFGHTIGHAIEAAAGCSTSRELPPEDFASLIPPTPDGAGPSHLSEMLAPPVVPQGTSALRGGHGRPRSPEAIPAAVSHTAADNSGVVPQAPVSVSTLGHVRGRGPQAERSGRDEPALRAKISGAEAPVGIQNGGSIYHGEAIAIGMLYMATGEAKERIEGLLKKYGLPTEDPFSVDELMEFAAHDKKRSGKTVKLVKVDQIGSFRFEEAGPEELRSIIQARKI